MADIVALEHPDNVTLIAGASQYWDDRPKPVLDVDWSQLLLPQVAGRTLLVGWAPDATLKALAGAADELHVLQRGIVGAAEAAEVVPTAKVWCGDPRALRDHTEPFDTVICLDDVSRVLPLESEERTWREVVDDVLALAKPEAAVLQWVENDLGLHRLINTHNPRAERSAEDWNPLATFDESRPVTLEQVRDAFHEATVYLTWPSRQWSVLVNPDTVDPATHAAFANRAAVAPLLGPDPVYMLSTAHRAGRLGEFASGWLVGLRLRGALTEPMYLAEKDRTVALDQALPEGSRTAFVVFAELAAKQDMPGVRMFIADWSKAYEEPKGAASLCLNVAEQDDDGTWTFTSIVEAATTSDDRWEALGELVGLMRARNWRHLWPSNYTDARILNHLGIMAGLHTVSPARAEQLIPPTPDAMDAYKDLDVQSLVAAIDRRNEQLHSLRSQLSLTKFELEKVRNSQGVLRTPRKVLRFAKRSVKSLLTSG